MDEDGVQVESPDEEYAAYRLSCLRAFFDGRKWHGGGAIPARLVDQGMAVVGQLDRDGGLVAAIDIADAALCRAEQLARSQQLADRHGWKRLISRLVPTLLHQCEEARVPRGMIPGIILLYLELCEGCRWRHLVNEKYELHAQESG